MWVKQIELLHAGRTARGFLDSCALIITQGKGPGKETLPCCLQGVSHCSNQLSFEQLGITSVCVCLSCFSLQSTSVGFAEVFGLKPEYKADEH